MSSPNRKRFKLAELRQQGVEALGSEPGVEIELDDGSTVTVPHPMLIDEPSQAAIDDAAGAIATAKAILGDEEHARFVAGGGHSNDIILAWRLMTKELETPKLPR